MAEGEPPADLHAAWEAAAPSLLELPEDPLRRMPAINLCLLLIGAGLSVAFLLNSLMGGPSGFVTHRINLNREANLTA